MNLVDHHIRGQIDVGEDAWSKHSTQDNFHTLGLPPESPYTFKFNSLEESYLPSGKAEVGGVLGEFSRTILVSQAHKKSISKVTDTTCKNGKTTNTRTCKWKEIVGKISLGAPFMKGLKVLRVASKS